MKNTSLSLLASICLLLFANMASASQENVPKDDTNTNSISNEDFKNIFQGYQASFVLLDTKTNKYIKYNPELCAVQLSPCSTFKIFNSLVGLETGILKGLDTTFKWDGTKYSTESWNHDQTLQSAISNSVVWYFQDLASLSSKDRMQHYLSLVHYGNEDMSAGLTQFWLGKSLKISADEQVALLNKLVHNQLPFSTQAMETVKKGIYLSKSEKGVLFGKTGSDQINGKWTLGWFVGYVTQPNNTYIFATNIQASDDAYGPKAKELTKQILNKYNLF